MKRHAVILALASVVAFTAIVPSWCDCAVRPNRPVCPCCDHGGSCCDDRDGDSPARADAAPRRSVCPPPTISPAIAHEEIRPAAAGGASPDPAAIVSAPPIPAPLVAPRTPTAAASPPGPLGPVRSLPPLRI